METKQIICDVCHKPILCGKIAEIKDKIATSIMHECCYVMITGGDLNIETDEYSGEYCDLQDSCQEYKEI